MQQTCNFRQVAGLFRDDADILDEVLVGEGPDADRHDNQPQNPKEEIEEEDQVLGTREVAHLQVGRGDGREEEEEEGEACGRRAF